MTDMQEDDFTAARRQSRIDLAAAYRLAALNEFHEGISNHFTLTVPGRPGRFYLNNWGMHWEEMTASSFLEVNYDGDILDGTGVADTTAVCIHGPIHRIVPDAHCVMHTHMPYCTALTQLEDMTLEMSGQAALRFAGKIAYDDEYTGLAHAFAEGERLANKMNGQPILMMANHGVVVTGSSVAEAYSRLYHLERACRTQLFSMWTRLPRRMVQIESPEEIQNQYTKRSPNMTMTHEAYLFSALKRGLDRSQPDYAK